MSKESAFEIGRMYLPLKKIADAISPSDEQRAVITAYMGLPGIRGYFAGNHSEDGSLIDTIQPKIPLAAVATQPIFGTAGTASYATYVTGGFTGGGLRFDITGTEAFVEPALRGLTVGAWVNFDLVDGNYQPIISKWSTSSQRAYVLRMDTDDTVAFLVSPTGGSVADQESPSIAGLTAGGWHFIVGRFRSGFCAIQVDGVLSENVITSTSIFDSTDSLYLGYRATTVQYLTGKLSNAFVCDQALENGVLSDLYVDTRGLYP